MAALGPGILTYSTENRTESYVALDEGVLAKVGSQVLISVRNAIGGADLGRLRQAVEQEFLTLDDQEKSVRTAMAQLESGLIRRFAELHRA